MPGRFIEMRDFDLHVIRARREFEMPFGSLFMEIPIVSVAHVAPPYIDIDVILNQTQALRLLQKLSLL